MHGIAEAVTAVMETAELSRRPENTTDSKPHLSDEQRKQNRENFINSIGTTEYWFKKCKIPKRYFFRTLDNFSGYTSEVKKALTAVENDESVFLSGSCGTGKTHLAIGLAISWIKKHIVFTPVGDEIAPLIDGNLSNTAPYFLPSVELFLKLKSTFGDKNVSEDDVINDLMRYPLLIIDDVGAEKISEWSRQMFYTLIDRCYRDMKPIIMTSNMDLSKIAEAFDDRISSRIVGMGSVITLTGDDYRMKK